MIDSDDDVGRLGVDVLEDDEVVDSEGFEGGDFPQQGLRGEDDEGVRVHHVVDLNAILVEASHLQDPTYLHKYVGFSSTVTSVNYSKFSVPVDSRYFLILRAISLLLSMFMNSNFS